jgi:hypothetical protein
MIATCRPSGRPQASGSQSSYACVPGEGRPAAQYGASAGSSRPVVSSASTQSRPSWLIRTRSWDAERPARRTVASMSAGPGSGARR